MKIKEFEQMTIGELKKLHEQYLQQHPEMKTAEELLEELNNQKEVKKHGI